jgi:hypothetical protein
VPDADIAFSNYKQRTKDEPHNKKMADAFMAQKVVQYIKLLPSYYTNLVKPRSMHLEDLVLRTQRCVDFADSCPAQKEGFDMLLHAILLVSQACLD